MQVLVIDEVHNILAGSYREQRIVLNTLRFLSNRLQISLVCFGVNEAREAISGDVQLARRFEQFTLSRWAANEQFETLVASILRNTPLRRPSVLTPKSLRRILQITQGITAQHLPYDQLPCRRGHREWPRAYHRRSGRELGAGI